MHNSAFYEHALLARLMGVHLVEGRDLVCHGTDVFLRTTEGEVPVHVIYRRIDDEYLDPLQFRPESLVGCPGVVNAARAGPGDHRQRGGQRGGRRQARLHLRAGHDPLLPGRGPDPAQRRDHAPRGRRRCGTDALARRDELVFKRVDGSGGKGLVIGPAATGAELDELALEVEADPRHWIAQRVVALSTSPTWVDHAMVRRHVDLRPFAVNDGEDIWVLPGGLTRVALAGGRAGGQLQPGRRLQGHLGGRRRARPCPCSRPRQTVPRQRRPAHGRRARVATPSTASNSSNSSSNRQHQHSRSDGQPMTRALLSRVAESIFWVGRYVERAEGTARILDVSVYQALEQSDVEGVPRRPPAPGRHGPARRRGPRRCGRRPSAWPPTPPAGPPSPARWPRPGRTPGPCATSCPVEFWEHINATWAALPRAVGGRPPGRARPRTSRSSRPSAPA